jgi:hypothetical protein
MSTEWPERWAKDDWLFNNWKWFIPVVIVGLLGLGVFTLSGGLIYFFNGGLKSSPVYQEALVKAKANPLVIRELGEPIEAGRGVNGSIKTQNSSGEAKLEIPIHGARGKATIHLEAKKTAGQWKYSVLQVVLDGQKQPIDLLTSK